MWGISYWVIPLFSSLTWLAMLLAMFLHWILKGKPHYPSMEPNQRIAYISDVGATNFKPLFIAMGAVTVITFDLGFIAERWLRHRGRLHQNTSMFQKILSIGTIIAAIVGAVGLILLTIFDTLRHNRAHNSFLAVFIIGYVVSAILVCWEYQRLGIHIREARVLRISFWLKLTFIILEVALAIAFGVTQRTHRNTAAILEWVVALVFTFYILSFFVDFIPAVHSKHHQSHETTEMAETNRAEGGGLPMTEDAGVNRYGHHVNGNGHAHTNGNGYTNGYTNGNGYVNGNSLTNGHTKPIIPPSRNF